MIKSDREREKNTPAAFVLHGLQVQGCWNPLCIFMTTCPGLLKGHTHFGMRIKYVTFWLFYSKTLINLITLQAVLWSDTLKAWGWCCGSKHNICVKLAGWSFSVKQSFDEAWEQSELSETLRMTECPCWGKLNPSLAEGTVRVHKNPHTHCHGGSAHVLCPLTPKRGLRFHFPHVILLTERS